MMLCLFVTGLSLLVTAITTVRWLRRSPTRGGHARYERARDEYEAAHHTQRAVRMLLLDADGDETPASANLAEPVPPQPIPPQRGRHRAPGSTKTVLAAVAIGGLVVTGADTAPLPSLATVGRSVDDRPPRHAPMCMLHWHVPTVVNAGLFCKDR